MFCCLTHGSSILCLVVGHMGVVFGSGAHGSGFWKWGSWEQCSVFGSEAHGSSVLCLVLGLTGAVFCVW